MATQTGGTRFGVSNFFSFFSWILHLSLFSLESCDVAAFLFSRVRTDWAIGMISGVSDPGRVQYAYSVLVHYDVHATTKQKLDKLPPTLLTTTPSSTVCMANLSSAIRKAFFCT
jgi:hypothetical protein